MKKSYILLILILFAPFFLAFAETREDSAGYLKLASWNIRIFSNTRTDDELRMICRTAKNFDFIGILELRDELILKRMVAMLKNEFGRSYSYELSPYVGGVDETFLYYQTDESDRGSNQELYAFLYDNTKVSVVTKGQVFNDSTFFRKPFYATFRSGNFDFTATIVHIIWGDSVEGRRKEIKRLSYVYQTIQDSGSENDVILMGDFNREPNDDLAWANLKAISSMTHLFDLPEKSMIWDTNLYDNIWFQSSYLHEYTLDHGMIRFDEIDFGNDDDAASAAVSDHRPVWALFRTTDGDDD